jgi:hypothetical protein
VGGWVGATACRHVRRLRALVALVASIDQDSDKWRGVCDSAGNCDEAKASEYRCGRANGRGAVLLLLLLLLLPMLLRRLLLLLLSRASTCTHSRSRTRTRLRAPLLLLLLPACLPRSSNPHHHHHHHHHHLHHQTSAGLLQPLAMAVMWPADDDGATVAQLDEAGKAEVRALRQLLTDCVARLGLCVGATRAMRAAAEVAAGTFVGELDQRVTPRVKAMQARLAALTGCVLERA